jgi:hypothetical protein
METAFKYTVQPGDSFDKIANTINDVSGVTFQEIEDANPKVSASGLQVGQEINIPFPEKESVEPQPRVNAKVMGYWNKTWSPSDAIPGANMSGVISGWAEFDNAFSESELVFPNLKGITFFTIGGGNKNGHFTAKRLEDFKQAILNKKLDHYNGICLDLEEGDAGLSDKIEEVCAVAKQNGFTVLVTISHAAPYEFPDAQTVMRNMFKSINIDYMSPQMYQWGADGVFDITTDPSLGIDWPDYKECGSIIIPSIDISTLYPECQEFFEGHGVEIGGYIQWSDVVK